MSPICVAHILLCTGLGSLGPDQSIKNTTLEEMWFFLSQSLSNIFYPINLSFFWPPYWTKVGEFQSITLWNNFSGLFNSISQWIWDLFYSITIRDISHQFSFLIESLILVLLHEFEGALLCNTEWSLNLFMQEVKRVWDVTPAMRVTPSLQILNYLKRIRIKSPLNVYMP